MHFITVDSIREAGFQGYTLIRALMDSNCSLVPNKQGVYFVLRVRDTPVRFLGESVGGHFKGNNPTVPVSELERNWVAGTVVVYIGKAGGGTSSATLMSRLRQYMDYGQGKPVGHKGGRYIWQIEDNRDLLVCWRATPDSNAREVEKELLAQFVSQYGQLPFANLVG